MDPDSPRQMSYGEVAIFDSKFSDLLGRGSYGKVCKAKCGQLPCAAKLPHDIILDSEDPNIRKFVEQFEQECQFLKMIKHPNVVQFLGTYRDPISQRLALLIELMDESLTRFLEQSTGPLPYHTQLNICQDVALALAYLHSNDIIHRDLSSNNVLLIGEGIRAKVTDFGMSKLFNNPHMTQLTKCPGNTNYMSPEALITPPRYSSKLDCFSHGVLTIQIATRQFPNPGDAHKYANIPGYSDGQLLVQIPETERRKKDIDFVAPDHPLLPLALHCLKDMDTERPSANELCERLATLKSEPRYTHSVEQSREQNKSVQTLQQQILDKDSQLERARSNHETELHELQKQLVRAKDQIQDKNSELERSRSNHERELCQCHATFQRQLQEREDELERVREQYEKELNAKETMLEQVITDYQAIFQEMRDEIHNCDAPVMPEHIMLPELNEVTSAENEPQNDNTTTHKAEPTEALKLAWRQGAPAPENMVSSLGAAVVHGNTAYFSQGYNVYSYTLLEDTWTTLPPCEYECFSLAVVNDKLTTIGGTKAGTEITSTLLCVSRGLSGQKWKQLLPMMPTARIKPAAVTTSTHLVVAGGRTKIIFGDGLSTVEVLDQNTLQWFSASSSPEALENPHITLCGGYLHLSQDNTIFSCSVEELLKSCMPPSTNVWTRLTDIPVPYYWASLATLRGHVLAIGGSKKRSGDNPTGVIHCYDRSAGSWSVIGEMLTARSRTLVAVLPSNEVIVVGGTKYFGWCKENEIGLTD